MSHEIRTPLNAILGFSEILSSKVKDSRQKEFLTSIITSGKSLLTLINDILDLSKVEAGKLSLEYTVIEPVQIFKEIQQIFNQKIKEKGLDFYLELDPALPVALLFDETRLRQILLNLVGNAVKFTDTGFIKLSATYHYADRSTDSTEFIFSVEDTGIGIPDEQREHIFGMFEQQKGQSNTKYGGTGLGLTITKRFVEIMNGKIEVSSQLGKGSKFSVVIKDVETVSLLDNTLEEAKQETEKIIFEKALILIVDNLEVNRKLLIGYLEEYEFEILESNKGQAVIDITKKHHPDLILTDVKMSVTDDYNTAIFLKENELLKDIPLIAVTASVMEIEENETSVIYDAILKKPFNKNELISELVKFLKHSLIQSIPENIKQPKVEISDIFNPENLDVKIRDHFPKLLEILEKEKETTWQELRNTLIFNDIEYFANRMKQLGKEYNFHPLSDWGETLLSQAVNFDVELMSATLDKFQEIIKILSDSIKID